MVRQRKYVVKRHFEGVPKRNDFEVVETELPPIKNGEILVKAEWLSVEPYQREFNGRIPVPYDHFGYQIGVVLESKDPRYPEGSRVVSHKGWCDHTIINASEPPNELDIVYKLPDLEGFSHSLGLGVIGMPGATAYFGFLEVCQPKADETVVVSGAAGTVGSLVGQIAKIKGCKVIGFAGSDDKVKWLEELGFDKALNYKTVDVVKALKEAAPQGVDCYFDCVGGEISSQILTQMNTFGRAAVCGIASLFNENSSGITKATIIQPSLLAQELTVEGMKVTRWSSRWLEAFGDLMKWVKSGQLKTKEDVTEGFDNVYDAFVGMLTGKNSGKVVVKV